MVSLAMQTLKYVRADYLMYHYPEVYTEVQEVARDNRAIYTMKRCLRAVCLYYGVTEEELKSKSREQHIVVPRHHFCWVVYRNRLDVSYPMLGRFLSKDHTTIVHAVNKFEENKDKYLAAISAVDILINSTERKAA
jgi:chromosomal replication initiation ATPase DnaA